MHDSLEISFLLYLDVTVMKIDSKAPSQMYREIDLAVDIDYTGGFIISLDVDLIFGKKASMTVRLKSLVGRIRLQFTRNPCTHWSFSFYEVGFTCVIHILHYSFVKQNTLFLPI